MKKLKKIKFKSKNVNLLCDCLGSGKMYDPYDPPDPMEGYKLVRLVRCDICDGKGFVPASFYEEKFQKELDKWNIFDQERIKLQKKLIEVLEKITEEECIEFNNLMGTSERTDVNMWSKNTKKAINKLEIDELNILSDFICYHSSYGKGWPSFSYMEDKKEGKKLK